MHSSTDRNANRTTQDDHPGGLRRRRAHQARRPPSRTRALRAGRPGQLAATFNKALVDTGAAHTQLPEELALQIGRNPRVDGAQVKISTAAGTASHWRLRVDLEFEGIFVSSVPVYFSPGAVDLVGRSTIYAACPTTGFERARWLRKY
ncbi:retropepsin-like aspartic protease [Nocardia niigatensis]